MLHLESSRVIDASNKAETILAVVFPAGCEHRLFTSANVTLRVIVDFFMGGTVKYVAGRGEWVEITRGECW